MREVVELVARIAELERRFSGMMRHGTVDQVDPARARVRLSFGSDDEGRPFLSPWLPYAQIAGALKVHTPPSVGQQFTMLAPTGDWRQAVALPMTWSDANPAPSSAGDAHVLSFGSVRLVVSNDRLDITVAGTNLTISGDGVAIQGGKVTHDTRNIGATHVHGGVVPGGANTDVPAN